MDYFYTPPEKISRASVEIDGEEYNHLVHVMRKKVGDTIRVVDGVGGAFDVEVSYLRKHAAVGKIVARLTHLNEPDLRVDIAAGILKNPSKFDFLVEKVTELGVTKVIPVRTSRTIPKRAKTERWQKLALAAMKQCGRSVLPAVETLRSLSSVLTACREYDLAVVCHEDVERSASLSATLQTRNLSKRGSVLVLIGPEGGFSKEETDACVKSGCVVVSLGPRRLRTETAAVVAAALVLQAR